MAPPVNIKAVDGDDDCGAFEILELGMLDFAIDLRQAFLAAHGQDGVAEGHEDTEEAHDGQSSTSQETECVFTELEI